MRFFAEIWCETSPKCVWRFSTLINFGSVHRCSFHRPNRNFEDHLLTWAANGREPRKRVHMVHKTRPDTCKHNAKTRNEISLRMTENPLRKVRFSGYCVFQYQNALNFHNIHRTKLWAEIVLSYEEIFQLWLLQCVCVYLDTVFIPSVRFCSHLFPSHLA